jgi:hypothetical protein
MVLSPATAGRLHFSGMRRKKTPLPRRAPGPGRPAPFLQPIHLKFSSFSQAKTIARRKIFIFRQCQTNKNQPLLTSS